MQKKTIALDFDGVIHTHGKYTPVADGAPIDGAFEFIQRLMVNFKVFILSVRPPEQIAEWLTRNNAPFPFVCLPADYPHAFWTGRSLNGQDEDMVGITNRKLAAIAYIDDRAVRFVPAQEGGTGFSQDLHDFLIHAAG